MNRADFLLHRSTYSLVGYIYTVLYPPVINLRIQYIRIPSAIPIYQIELASKYPHPLWQSFQHLDWGPLKECEKQYIIKRERYNTYIVSSKSWRYAGLFGVSCRSLSICIYAEGYVFNRASHSAYYLSRTHSDNLLSRHLREPWK